jgi:hypothetical protein
MVVREVGEVNVGVRRGEPTDPMYLGIASANASDARCGAVASPPEPYFSTLAAMTTRWISLVPS